MMSQDIVVSKSLKEMKKRLDDISPSMCLAKWLQVSLHLTTGHTHSCYHPPVHSIDKNDIQHNPSALHNTKKKKEEREQMLKGERPPGCSYCWKIEDTGHSYSDRHYRTEERWASPLLDVITNQNPHIDVIPTYVEVNFNQSCQFKCTYCSPHLSTSWMEEIRKYGRIPTIIPHNDITHLKKQGRYPIPPDEKNPYVDVFWKWWPTLYPQLKVFRMTGGEPLVDHNTFRILNYLEEYPNTDLELAITSNLCPPKKMMKKFVHHVTSIEKKGHIAYFMVFPSIDTWGSQAEYIRYGLDINEFEKNVKLLLSQSETLIMSFILTSTALSVFNLKSLLEKILSWTKEFSLKKRRILFDVPYLYNPAWMSMSILPDKMAEPYLKRMYCLYAGK